MTIPHYKIVEIGGKNLVVFYPQFKDDEGYKIIDLENRFPIELKNEEEYKMFLEAIIESEDLIKDGLKTLADLVDEMSLLAKGPKGDTRFMWVKYADDDKGSGMSDNPAGKKYIGMAFNKDKETPSNNASDYNWVKYVADYEGLEIGGRNLIGDFNLKPWASSSGVIHTSGIGLAYAVKLDNNTDYVASRKTIDYNNRFRFAFFTEDFKHADEIIDKSYDKQANHDNDLIVKFNSEQYNWLVIYVTNQKKVDDIDKSFIKLEKGIIATDWTPAPEDIYALIDDIDAEHVGLGNVQNYGIASQSQAENGTSNNAYMTPLRTKQAIEKLLEDIGVVYVVESYEENDTFVTKYSDGKMEMTQYRNMGSVGANGNGTIENPYRSGSYTWEFPEPFVEEPVVLITPNADDSYGNRRLLTAYYRENRVNDVTYIQVASISDKFPSNDAYVNLLAIGRWK